MKLLILFAVMLCIASPADEIFSRTIIVGKKKEIPLVQEGKCKSRIVIPANAKPVVKFAAGELQTFIKQSTGIKIPIVDKPQKGFTSIILGFNPLSSSLGTGVELPRDGFIIRTAKDKLFIAGRDDPHRDPNRTLKEGMWDNYYERATLFAVYDFLERFAGCRFFFPGVIGTVVPKRKSLIIPSINIVDAPDFTSRSYTRNEHWESGPLPPAKHHQRYLNSFRLRFSTDYIPNCHGLNKFAYLKRFAKSHPEYFALNANGKRMVNPNDKHAGQLCLSSNIVNEICKDAEAFLSGKPAASRSISTKYGPVWIKTACKSGYFNIMPQDAFYLCRCEKCQKHFSRGAQATSEYIWSFFNMVGNYLQTKGIPGTLTTMAYPPYRKLPTSNIPSNIMVKVAERGPWVEHIPAIRDKDDAEIRAWVKKMGRKVELWNYANKFGRLAMPGVPSMTPRCIASYYKRQKKHIVGGYMESESDKFIYHYLNYYVFMKVAWNTSTDIDQLLDDHYRAMFGPARNVMKSIFELFEKNWTRRIFGKPYVSPQGPTTAPASEYQIWEVIYSPQEINSIKELFNQAEALAAQTPDALARVKYIRHEFLTPLQQESARYFKRKNATGSLIVQAKILPESDNIKIDGKLNDPAWASCNAVEMIPYNNAQGKQVKTTVLTAIKNGVLYVAYKCNEPEMANVFHGKRKKDDSSIWQDNSVELFINPSGDKKNYYHFIVNSTGCFSDAKAIKKGSGQQENWEWNSNAQVKTAEDATGWNVEMAIPLDTYKEAFPINFSRSRILRNGKDYVKYYTWSPFLKQGFHDLVNFGWLNTRPTAMNLVRNGNFSELTIKNRYFGKWIGPGKAELNPGRTFSLVDNAAKGLCLKLTNHSNGRIVVIQEINGLKPNTDYQLTYDVKIKDVRPLTQIDAGVCANLWDGKNYWFPRNRFTGTMPWTRQVFKFRTSKPSPGKKYKGTIRLFLLNASGSAWFDNVNLIKTDAVGE